MAKEEILSGLKNAISRGSPIDQAAQSFINAGYNPQEVQQAKEELSSGNYSTISQSPNSFEGPQPHQFNQPSQSIQTANQQNIQNQAPNAFSENSQRSLEVQNLNSSRQLQSFQQPSQKKKGKGIVILLSIFLILLLIILGTTIFFSESILNLIS